MAVTHKLIETVTVTAGGGAASIEFASIPQTYTDLKLVLSLRDNSTGSTWGDATIQFNGNVTATTTRLALFGTGSSAATGAETTSNGRMTITWFSSSTSTASTFGNGEIYIPNYTGSTNKSVLADSVSENNATAALAILVAGLYQTTSAITSITVNETSNFTQYSSASLYGISKS
jgi:hypothetical protein